MTVRKGSRRVKEQRGPLARWRRVVSDTNVSFVISVAIHAALFLLLASTGAKQVSAPRKLTEVSYVDERYYLAERYGEAVAKKVSFAPEKLALPSLAPSEHPSLEGSMFATGPALGLPPNPGVSGVPSPVATPDNAPNPFAAPLLKSRARHDGAPGLPRAGDEHVLLGAGINDNPRRTVLGTDHVDLKGKVLVGRRSRLGDDALFAVEGGDGPALAGALTLAVPDGGSAEGHPDLVGGTLAEGKQAYRGPLPKGNLVARDGSRDRLTALAALQVAGPGGGGTESALAGTGPLVEPSRGTGLVSRGGSDAVSRGGGLKTRAENGARTAEAIVKGIAPERTAAETATAPADAATPGGTTSGGKPQKAVSMTLSGPVLGREILASRAPDYPLEAKQRGWQGTVSVYFTVLPDGSIKKVFVEQASPHQVLDEAAKGCLANWRFSPLPTGTTGEQWGVLTILYRLR